MPIQKKDHRISNLLAWVVVFIAFSAFATKGIFKNIDIGSADIILAYANPVADQIFSAARSLGQLNICIAMALIIAISAYSKRSKKFAVSFIIIFIFLLYAGYELKILIRKERPSALYRREARWYLRYPGAESLPGALLEKEKEDMIKEFSYPSGHSSRTFFLFFALAMLADGMRLSKRTREILRGALYSLILLVGFSSMYIGAHWLTDIIGAYVLGYIFILVLKGVTGEGH